MNFYFFLLLLNPTSADTGYWKDDYTCSTRPGDQNIIWKIPEPMDNDDCKTYCLNARNKFQYGTSCNFAVMDNRGHCTLRKTCDLVTQSGFDVYDKNDSEPESKDSWEYAYIVLAIVGCISGLAMVCYCTKKR